jgi:HD-GYP domain-containing protein (c-di-GMP phosphodiesterase class II)
MIKIDVGQFLMAIYRGESALDGNNGITNYLHGLRVGLICLEAGQHLGMDRDRLITLGGCALLHDIVNPPAFKVSLERTPSQRLLRLHCSHGQEMMDLLPFPSTVDGFIRYHHEFIDGSGPFGKRSDEIPFEASLICLAGLTDMFWNFDSLGSYGLRFLRSSMKELAGKSFNPEVVEAILAVMDGTLLHLLRSDVIISVCRTAFPAYEQELTNEQMYRIGLFVSIMMGAQSPYTHLHSEQVANIAWKLGQARGYDEDKLAMLYLTGCMHDCGKLSISGQLLDKQDALSPEELQIIQSHALVSILELQEVNGLAQVVRWAGNHHERLDGSGYPHGYGEDQLDEVSQLLAVCDVYEAASAERPYHKKRSSQELADIMGSQVKQHKLNGEMVDQAFELLSGYEVGKIPGPPVFNQDRLDRLQRTFNQTIRYI